MGQCLSARIVAHCKEEVTSFPPKDPYPGQPTRVLPASAIEDHHVVLRRVLSGALWQVADVSGSQDARSLLLAHKMLVVICAVNLSDRDRNAFPVGTPQTGNPPKVILSTCWLNLTRPKKSGASFTGLGTPGTGTAEISCLNQGDWSRSPT